MVERIVVYDPRSLARIWLLDETTDDYIPLPYRVVHPDMTYAQSVAARAAFRDAAARDRSERRLFDNLDRIRAIEAQAKSVTARRRAERTVQAQRSRADQPPTAENASRAGRRSSIAELRRETLKAIADVGLRLRLIDDLHNIRGANLGSLLVERRNLGSVTDVSLGGFATGEIAYVLRYDEQLANRFELLTLPRWQFDDVEYAKLLATFAQLIPLERPSALTEPSLARGILLAANGLIGGIASLLRQAAVEAIRTGHERIDAAMLRRARPASPERMEAAGLAPDL